MKQDKNLQLYELTVKAENDLPTRLIATIPESHVKPDDLACRCGSSGNLVKGATLLTQERKGDNPRPIFKVARFRAAIEPLKSYLEAMEGHDAGFEKQVAEIKKAVAELEDIYRVAKDNPRVFLFCSGPAEFDRGDAENYRQRAQDALHKIAAHLLKQQAAPDNLITIGVAIQNFGVTRRHIQRLIDSGELKSYRPDGAKGKPHIVSAKEIAARFGRNK